MAGLKWTPEEIETLKRLAQNGFNEGKTGNELFSEIGNTLNRSHMSVRLKWERMLLDNPSLTNDIPHKASDKSSEITEAEYADDYINIVCASKRITTVDQAIAHFKIDLEKWEVDRYKIKTSEAYRKDRQVRWQVEEGVVLHGDVTDTGKLLIAPMFHIQITLKRKVSEIRARQVIQDFIQDAKKHAPKYPKMVYKKRSQLWYEVDMPDIHFGKETWAEESGHDYNLKIAREVVLQSLEKLLSYTASFGIEKIILPMGNDFFNSNNKENTTSHGTPQQEDTRWTRTFKEGRRLAVDMIDRCAAIAPVCVMMVAGNHDEERLFYLGEVLDAQYHNVKHVTVDNRAAKRKYLSFGQNLVCFTHGYYEKLSRLPALMPLEEPMLWAASKHREFHLGDKHHKVDLLHRTEDVDGVTIRILRSLSATDTWHFDKGYVGSPRSAESFLWDKHDGVIAQFQSFLHNKPN